MCNVSEPDAVFEIPAVPGKHPTLYQISFMILDLSKRFAFNKENNEYIVEYRFTRENDAKLSGNIDLTLNVSLNHAAATTMKLSKPTSVLYQSNELIERMIEETVVGGK